MQALFGYSLGGAVNFPAKANPPLVPSGYTTNLLSEFFDNQTLLDYLAAVRKARSNLGIRLNCSAGGMTALLQRIRGFYDDMLYKSTFYLLTYLLTYLLRSSR